MLLASGDGLRAQSLGGSAASLDRQNAQALSHSFTYLETPGQVRSFVDNGYLVPVVPSGDFELKEVSFPYARPEVRLFIERLASQYRSACGEKLVVTSLTRPLSEQPRNASDRSVHPTGMAVDLRRSNRAACRRWLESTLTSLEGRGVLEATRERRPPHYHLAIYPDPYARYVTRITGSSVTVARQTGDEPVIETRWIEHTVRRGETLGGIGSRYGVTVGRIRAENGIRGDRLLVGQRLQVPVYEVASPSSQQAAFTSAPAEESPGFASHEPEAGLTAAASPAAVPSEPAAERPTRHRVARGESLWVIARRYGVAEATLRRANRLSGDRIISGQELVVPRGSGTTPASFRHRVSRGESLWTIARAYGVSENAIRAANGIRGSRILIGETLTIPTGDGGAVLQHTVERGESLWTIANRHGTTVEALRRTNGIRSSRIYAGQTLNVPLRF